MEKQLLQEQLQIHIYKSKIKCFTQSDINMFSGGNRKYPKKTIHTSIDVAKNCGLETTIISGAITEGMICELLTSIYGDRWLNNGQLSVKFVKQVLPNDLIVAFSKVTTGYKIIDVWCENQYGEKVTVGTATT